MDENGRARRAKTLFGAAMELEPVTLPTCGHARGLHTEVIPDFVPGRGAHAATKRPVTYMARSPTRNPAALSGENRNAAPSPEKRFPMTYTT